VAVISGGRFNRGVQKFLGIKGETVIPDLDSALQAGLDVDDVDSLDQRFLFGWRSYGIPLTNAGGANNFTCLQLGNPAGSGVIAVIERWRAYVSSVVLADQEIELLISATVQPQSSGILRDKRQLQTGVTGAVCFGGAGNSAGTGGTRLGRIAADTVSAAMSAFDIVKGDGRDELLLMPGDNWTIATNTNPPGGLAAACTIWWRERALDPSELTA
jgi:hypothetical protein